MVHLHHLHALDIVAGSTTRVRVLGLARSTGLPLSLCAVDAHPLSPTGGLEHVLGGIVEPAIDEIAVQAISLSDLWDGGEMSASSSAPEILGNTYLSAGQLQRWHSVPSLRNELPDVVSNGEPKLGHPLHAGRAATAVGRSVGVLLDVGRVDAIRESQDGLDVRAARHTREGGARPVLTVLGPVLAPPGDTRGSLVHVGLALGAGVAGDGEEVVREGDLGLVDVLVVGAEHDGVDFGVVALVHVEESRRPWLFVSP